MLYVHNSPARGLERLIRTHKEGGIKGCKFLCSCMYAHSDEYVETVKRVPVDTILTT